MFADPAGRITRFSRVAADLAKASRLDGRAILPGLVSTYSHTFQVVIRWPDGTSHRRPADTFWAWRESMYHAANRLSQDAMHQAARMAFLAGCGKRVSKFRKNGLMARKRGSGGAQGGVRRPV
jgi:cytosine/adenosine deaminase-related metal-dependent hydrolase